MEPGDSKEVGTIVKVHSFHVNMPHLHRLQETLVLSAKFSVILTQTLPTAAEQWDRNSTDADSLFPALSTAIASVGNDMTSPQYP